MSETTIESFEEAELARARGLGYQGVCYRGERGVCGVRPFLFTGALVFGIGPEKYKGRYCYATLAEAFEALQAWDGQGDAPGAWIKLKSEDEERVGPGCNE